MSAAMPFLLRIAAMIGLALLLLFAGHRAGTHRVQAKWDKERAERAEADNRAMMTRLRNNERVAEQQQIDKQRLKKSRADEKTQLDATYALDRGLRINAAVCAEFARPAEAGGAGGSNAGTAAAGLLPEPYQGNIKSLMREAEDIVADCRTAQEFIRSNGMAP